MIHLRRPMSAQRPRVTERRTFARNAALFAVVATGMIAGPAHAAGELVLTPHIPTLVILLVGFVVLIFPLNSMIFRPLFRVLDDRDAKIAGATKDAQGLVTQADDLMNEYRGKIREARDDAATARREQIESARSEQTSITGDAKAEAEDEIRRARQEINESLAEARVTIKAASREVASVAAESILGRSL